MAYISKETLLAAYKKLSTLSADPSTQGATQKISTIRYFLALDMFYRQFGRECNVKDKNDAAQYIENVGKVVSVNGNLYTTNFFYPLSDNSDYAVGSNFYSVNVVRESTTNGGEKLVFPRRGGKPIMYVQSGVLYEDDELTKNIEIYISSADYRTALIIWLLRNKNIDATNFYNSALITLKSMFTNNFIDILIPTEMDFDAYSKSIGISFSQAISEISAKDITAIFNHKSAPSEFNHTPLQKIWFGAPGSGKSYKVKQLTETSNDEGFEGMTTEERQMAYQEYLDKKNAGKSSYRGGKTNFKALSHPKLMKYVAESSGYEINSLFEISREDAFNEITEALDKYEPYLEDSITKGSDCHWKTGLNSYGDFIKEQSKSSSKRKDIEFRATFHPDYDYASFVGCYKPSMNDGKIEYSFTPQVFTKAYIAAWENTSKPVYLVIEEINRGNCAQIFGDIFQLLDRDQSTGMSQYPIQVDKDLSEYIETRLGSGHPGIAGGNLQLPANLHIYATMNTSDQSLFPMDSAFKRRWDWEYVPIDLKCPESQFTITIGDIVYKWPSFLEKVNERIHALSDSEDKQMGNFFIKHDVEVEEFKSKVMFYLWSEVCKEYEKSGSFFKNRRNSDAEFTFNSLFPTNDVTNSILQGFMEYLGVEIVSAPQPSEQTVADSISNQEAE